jgi:hypothetical protein
VLDDVTCLDRMNATSSDTVAQRQLFVPLQTRLDHTGATMTAVVYRRSRRCLVLLRHVAFASS